MKTEYMKMAIELSKKGIGFVNPNPLVGAVIVKNGKVIGTGFHEKFGEAHAEVNAFNNATETVENAEMYVTLEPCSHYGKTPPCVDKIIEEKISKVYIGMKDPNAIVAGRGIQKLIDNKIEVEVGICEEEIKKLNEIFIKYITTLKPFCIMKTAMSLDGKIATHLKHSKWITNEKSRNYVHELRNRVAAIMVGVGTVISDNPSLDTRLERQNISNPIRIIVDIYGEIPLDSKVLSDNSIAPTIVVLTPLAKQEIVNEISKKAEVMVIEEKDGKVDLKVLMEELGKKGIDSILLEGGGTLNWSMLEEGLVDKVISFIAPKIIGGIDAITPVEGQGIKTMDEAILLENIDIQRFDNDIMIEAYIRKEQ